MYARLPVVAVNSGGPTESVVDGETGFLVPPDPAAFATALSRILDTPTERTVRPSPRPDRVGPNPGADIMWTDAQTAHGRERPHTRSRAVLARDLWHDPQPRAARAGCVKKQVDSKGWADVIHVIVASAAW